MKVCASKSGHGLFCMLKPYHIHEQEKKNVHVATDGEGFVYEVWSEDGVWGEGKDLLLQG